MFGCTCVCVYVYIFFLPSRGVTVRVNPNFLWPQVGEVSVEVSSLRLGATLVREPALGELWLELLLPAGLGDGADGPPPSQRKRRQAGASTVALECSHTARLDVRDIYI